MTLFIGFIVVAFILLYTRSTGIIVVNPLHGARPSAAPADEDDDDEQSVPDFARLVNTIREAATPAEERGRAAILKLVQNNQFIEAMQLYRRLYGVDLQTAKRAVDAMMLER